MPIEIRELIIKAFVDASNGQKKKEESKSCEGNSTEKAVQESIDQFSEILKQERER